MYCLLLQVEIAADIRREVDLLSAGLRAGYQSQEVDPGRGRTRVLRLKENADE